MAYGRQTAPGVPGSFPLPNPGNAGTTYTANAVHPSAAAATSSVEAANDPEVRADTISAVKAGVLPRPDGVPSDIARMIAQHRAAGGKGG